MSNKKKLRVWLNRNGRNTYVKVQNEIEAEEIIRKAIAKDLKDENISSNAFGLEIFEDNGDGPEWCEWYCERAMIVGVHTRPGLKVARTIAGNTKGRTLCK